MKERYEEPVMELILFENCDVITNSCTSDNCTSDDGNIYLPDV